MCTFHKLQLSDSNVILLKLTSKGLKKLWTFMVEKQNKKHAKMYQIHIYLVIYITRFGQYTIHQMNG